MNTFIPKVSAALGCSPTARTLNPKDVFWMTHPLIKMIMMNKYTSGERPESLPDNSYNN